MTLEEIKNMLEATGLPVAYRAFPINDAPPLPFICFTLPGTNNFAADDTVYLEIDSVEIELYTEYKSLEDERKVEKALAEYCWEKTTVYIDSERCYQTIYEIEV